MEGTVGLHLFSIHHAEHGLNAVKRVVPAVPGLAKRLVADHPAVRGAVVLSTCNRLEIYLDADAAAPGAGVGLADVRAALAAGLPGPSCPADIPLRARHATEVLWHLFEVGAGLDSMVVGEREIAGQLRRALKHARREGTATYLLTESIEQALRTSRRVAHLTSLASNGRSVVAVGLDLLRRDWATSRVLLLGTGAYAGAVVSALSARGCTDITVHSASGRAASFAESHDVRAASGSVADALGSADVVIACRGVGTPVLTRHVMVEGLEARQGRPMDVVDLALARDAEASVGELEGVRLLDLQTIQRHVPDASAREVSRAERLVAEGVEDLVVRLKGRQLDPAVVALRDTVTAMVADEIDRLPQGRPLTAEEAAHALRRLAARMIHEPSVRARKAAEAGDGQSYLEALSVVYGIEAPLAELGRTASHYRSAAHYRTLDRPVFDPDTLDAEKCPVVGYDLSDLGERPRLEAM